MMHLNRVVHEGEARVIPSLGEVEWESDGGTIFFFHLLLGVKLHNEPTPVAKVTFVH